ncbi:WD repeat domain phosphoinositide-interacting protein 1-like [Babylonia areolata]|uniref:WD repeat domain phosphoinositide-interacting protein 1-like n=1 Tax=Babylonia areolata TaxID=304850 RepID=UPI003FD0D606
MATSDLLAVKFAADTETITLLDGEDIEGARILERIDTRLLAGVLLNSPCTIRTWCIKDGKARLILNFEEMLEILDVATLQLVQRITCKATSSVMDLCISTRYLAYPTMDVLGYIQIVCTASKKEVVNIMAHDSEIAALTFSLRGDKIATASLKGTVIRVFSVNRGDKIFEFRRGLKRTVDISCLSFSMNDTFLTVASNMETVHVFYLERAEPGWLDCMFNSVVKSLGKMVEACITLERATATATMPKEGSGKVCSVVSIEDKPHLAVASLEGDLHIFLLPPKSAVSAECYLTQHYRLTDATGDKEPTADVTNTTPSSQSFGDFSRWMKGLKGNENMPSTSSPADASASTLLQDNTTASSSSSLVKRKN